MFTLTRLFNGLRARLFLLVLLAIVPMLGLILYTDLEQRQRDLAQVEADALHITRLVANTHQDLIENARSLLATLALLPQVRGDDPDTCNDLLARTLKQNPQYTNLTVAQVNGDVFCSGVPFTGQVSFSERAVFKRALETRGFVVGGYEIGPITKRPILSIAYPIPDSSGRVRRVVMTGLDLTWLNQVAANVQLSEGSRITLIDRDGIVLARYPDVENWVGRSAANYAIIQTILTRGEGTAEGIGLDDTPRLFAFTPVNKTTDTGAYLFTSIPRATAFAAEDATLARNLAVLLVVTAIAFALAWIGGGRLVLRDIRMLVQTMRQLAAGDLRARTTFASGVDELGELARHFDEMADVLEQRDARQKQIQVTLRESESKHRIVADNTYDWEFWVDPAGQFVYLSPSCERITGYTVDEFSADADLLNRIIYPDDRAFFAAHRQTVEHGITSNEIEFRIICRDGSLRWIGHACQPVFDDAGNFLGTRGSNRDITERKRAQDASRESEERFRGFIEQTSEGIVLVDEDARVIVWNEAMAQMTGLPREEVIGEPAWKFLMRFIAPHLRTPEIAQQTAVTMLNLVRDGQGQILNAVHEMPVYLADGSVHIMQQRMFPIKTTRGYRIGAVSTDVTTRKRAEDALRQSEERFRGFIEQTLDGVLLLDEEARVIEWNQAMAEMTGLPREEVVGRPVWESQLRCAAPHRRTPEVAEHLKMIILGLIRDGQGGILNVVHEMPIYRADGSVRIVQERLFPIKTGRGYRIGGVLRDVTEQKRIEQELQTQRDFALQVVNTMGQGLTVTDAEGRFVFVNPAYARMTGYAVEDLIGKRPRDVTFAEDHATLGRARAERALGKTTTYETRFRRADGGHVHASITGVPRARAGEYAGTIAVITDLTERMRMEQVLRESESLYHSLIEALPISLCRKDLESKFVFANLRYCEEFGKTLSDIVGKSDYDLHPPELVEKYRADDRRVIESGETLDTIEEHQPLAGAKTFVQALKTPWCDSRGNVVGIQIIYWDVTERVLAEQQLVHASSHDALTGLYNRAYFEQELARLEPSRQFPVSVVIADVDGLKRVNDQQGHDAGDELLKRAAVVLAAAFRTEDIVARIGGDEFAVLLPATDAEAVAEAVRRIRKILGVRHATRAEVLLELSIGVATASRGTSLSEAIKQADAQMYREKEEHRRENDK